MLGSGRLSRARGFLRAQDGVRLGWGWWREGQGWGEFWGHELSRINSGYSWALGLLGTEGMNEEEGGEETKG